MKKIFLYITTILAAATFTATTATAQDGVETPTLTSIEVNSEGIPVLSWTVSNPDLVDGYIVKRLIVDGQGVIPGTYNNVAVIDDNMTFTYTDRSNEYGTYAMTGIRKEYYCMAAYVIDDNGQKHYSLMSEPVSTITLKANYDYCDDTYTLEYSSMDMPGSFSIMQLLPSHETIMTSTDTTVTKHFDTFASSRTFQIQWTGSNGIKTSSPIVIVKGDKAEPPTITKISYATIDDNNQIALHLSATDSQSAAEAQLIRRNIATGAETTTTLPDHIMQDYVYTDQDASPDSAYSYLLVINDKCGHRLSLSDSAYNVVVTPLAEATNSNLVSWTSMHRIEGGVESNAVFRRIDNGYWEQIAEVGQFYNDYRDQLSNMIADENIYNGQFCYYVIITCQNGNIIRSGTACLQREPIIYIPNAFNPKSDILDNRTFRPRADFLADYHLAIYDKRGAIIYQSDDLNEGWDGYDRSSKLCNRDTYVYHITFKTSSGKQVAKSGMVNLLY
jgi:hypothetical protein